MRHFASSSLLALVVLGAVACRQPLKENRKEASHTPVQVNSNPESLLQDGAMAKIQEALSHKGLGDEHWKKGELDPPTSTAIRKLQKQEHLPATGVPDGRTAMALGLDPGEVMKRRPLE